MNWSGKQLDQERQIAVPPAVLVAEDRDRLVAQRLDHAGDKLQGPMRKGRALRIAAVNRVVELAGKDGDALQIDQPHARLGQRLAQAGTQADRFPPHRSLAAPAADPSHRRAPRGAVRRRGRPAVSKRRRRRPAADRSGSKRPKVRVRAVSVPCPIDRAPSSRRSRPVAGRLCRACGRRRDHGLQPLVELIAADSFRHFPDAGRDDQRPQVRPVARFVGTEEEMGIVGELGIGD